MICTHSLACGKRCACLWLPSSHFPTNIGLKRFGEGAPAVSITQKGKNPCTSTSSPGKNAKMLKMASELILQIFPVSLSKPLHLCRSKLLLSQRCTRGQLNVPHPNSGELCQDPRVMAKDHISGKAKLHEAAWQTESHTSRRGHLV